MSVSRSLGLLSALALIAALSLGSWLWLRGRDRRPHSEPSSAQNAHEEIERILRLARDVEARSPALAVILAARAASSGWNVPAQAAIERAWRRVESSLYVDVALAQPRDPLIWEDLGLVECGATPSELRTLLWAEHCRLPKRKARSAWQVQLTNEDAMDCVLPDRTEACRGARVRHAGGAWWKLPIKPDEDVVDTKTTPDDGYLLVETLDRDGYVAGANYQPLYMELRAFAPDQRALWQALGSFSLGLFAMRGSTVYIAGFQSNTVEIVDLEEPSAARRIEVSRDDVLESLSVSPTGRAVGLLHSGKLVHIAGDSAPVGTVIAEDIDAASFSSCSEALAIVSNGVVRVLKPTATLQPKVDRAAPAVERQRALYAIAPDLPAPSDDGVEILAKLIAEVRPPRAADASVPMSEHFEGCKVPPAGK